MNKASFDLIDNKLKDLGFAKLAYGPSVSYSYRLNGLKLCIYPLDVDNLTVSPFMLIIRKGKKKILEKYFSDLDDLLKFIVNGGE